MHNKTKTTYDAIIVLGYSFDEHGRLPEHLIKRLGLAADLLQDSVAPRVIVCGDHSIQWDWADIAVDTRECDLMQHELINRGVSSSKILREHWSRDTAGSFYYLKTKLLQPHNLHRVLVLCATHNLARSKFLTNKILGHDYSVDFHATYSPASHNPLALHREQRIYREEKQWLALMEDGNEQWFGTNFYQNAHYKKHQSEAHNPQIPQMLARMGV